MFRASTGQVQLEKEDIERLFGFNHAVETTLFLDRNPFKPAKEQALVRGNLRRGVWLAGPRVLRCGR
jgi:hypothetical protein